ncbi:MAG: hypothetical protein IMW97_02110 [Firmicutes bacterium]|nr:hypothetical protein [Candidatus Fermentithermobacillaceae bacterium]
MSAFSASHVECGNAASSPGRKTTATVEIVLRRRCLTYMALTVRVAIVWEVHSSKMTLRLSTDASTKALEARLGAEGMQELGELIIHAFLPETLRNKVALTTPHLDASLGNDLVQELKDFIRQVAELVSRGIGVQLVVPRGAEGKG